MIKRPLCLICICFLAIQAGRVISGQVPSVRQVEPDLRAAAEREESVSVSGFVFQIESKGQKMEIWLKDAVVTASGREAKEQKIIVWMDARFYESSQDSARSRDRETDRNRTASQKDGENQESGFRAVERIRIGNQLCVRGRIGIFESPRNPGEFDRQAYYGRKGAAMFVNAKSVDILSGQTDLLRDRLSYIRAKWKMLLIHHLGNYYGNTVCSILLGEKSGLDQEMRTMYQKNGIGHLLAISGLHMSFIGIGLYHILRKMGCSFGKAGVTGSMVLILYTMMIGAGVSSLRALIMFLIRIGADITGRDYDLPTSLAVSASALCAVQPLYLTDAGFLLSFGAILGLILLTPVYGSISRNRLWTGFSGGLAVNTMLIGPTLYFYYEVPPYSLFMNLLVIPALPVVMAAGIAGSFLSLVNDPLGGGVLKIAGLVLRGYDLLCEAAQTLPYSRIVTGRPGWILLLAYYLSILFVCLLHHVLQKGRGRREAADPERENGQEQNERRWKWGSDWMPGVLLAAAVFGMVFLCKSSHSTEGEIQVTMLDVGQGDGIFVRGPYGGTYFIDGGSSDVKSVGEYRIEPFLLSAGTKQLDYVFLSHGDADHMSGIEELLNRQDIGVRIRTLVLPPPGDQDENLCRIAKLARETGTRVVFLYVGQRIRERANVVDDREKGMEIVCLAPDGAVSAAGDNASSMVLHLRYGTFDMLFTGDLEGAGEEALVRRQILPSCDVLKVAHHGSKYSTSEEFLEHVRPSLGLISAGRENRYGHPHEETLRRLEEASCRVYSTQKSGAVTIESNGNTLRVNLFIGENTSGAADLLRF